MKARFGIWLWQWLIAIDQLAGMWSAFVYYVLLGRGDPPNADETISSFVGRHAIAGARWALIAERIIDRLFRRFDGPGHCRRSVEWDEVKSAAVPPPLL